MRSEDTYCNQIEHKANINQIGKGNILNHEEFRIDYKFNKAEKIFVSGMSILVIVLSLLILIGSIIELSKGFSHTFLDIGLLMCILFLVGLFIPKSIMTESFVIANEKIFVTKHNPILYWKKETKSYDIRNIRAYYAKNGFISIQLRNLDFFTFNFSVKEHIGATEDISEILSKKGFRRSNNIPSKMKKKI